jgi:hypothetical protein
LVEAQNVTPHLVSPASQTTEAKGATPMIAGFLFGLGLIGALIFVANIELVIIGAVCLAVLGVVMGLVIGSPGFVVCLGLLALIYRLGTLHAPWLRQVIASWLQRPGSSAPAPAPAPVRSTALVLYTPPPGAPCAVRWFVGNLGRWTRSGAVRGRSDRHRCNVNDNANDCAYVAIRAGGSRRA